MQICWMKRVEERMEGRGAQGNTHWVDCPIETRLNMLKKLRGQVTKLVKSRHLHIQDVQGRNCMGTVNASGLLRNGVPSIYHLS